MNELKKQRGSARLDTEIVFERRGRAGFVTLNRPEALNALTQDMVRALAARLDAWASDPTLAHVVIKGAGDKAFCAGGDIRRIYDARKAGQVAGLGGFFRDEYLLNAQIKAYPKPFVALIDGIVMGGGVGVSVHGSHRIGTENTLFSMPETAIGFFPDIGGTYFLPRMPKRTGVYCALSAGRMKQGDALATGVLTHAVAADRLAALEMALEGADDLDALLCDFQEMPTGGPGQRKCRSHRSSVFGRKRPRRSCHGWRRARRNLPARPRRRSAASRRQAFCLRSNRCGAGQTFPSTPAWCLSIALSHAYCRRTTSSKAFEPFWSTGTTHRTGRLRLSRKWTAPSWQRISKDLKTGTCPFKREADEQ